MLAVTQVLIFDTRIYLFHGFNRFTWVLIVLSAFGGLIISFVLKYTDSIIKVRNVVFVSLAAFS